MSKWDELSMAEKAEMMKVAVRQGITNLSDIKQRYNEFAEGGSKERGEEVNTNSYSVGNLVNALYQNNPKEKYLGEPEHHYDFAQSEEWANAHGYYPDARGHRDDRVKKPAHPSHPSRGVWDGDKFVLTDFGMQNPNYTLFGLNDGGQDPQATLIYNNSVVLPELTVTPNENYFFNPYDNIELHYAEGGNLFGGGGNTVVTDDLVDWTIREEGFNKQPEDIGDGKITLGSGLTAKRWHDLYKKRGNKWSNADNRMAVRQELSEREAWARNNIPNWKNLPDSSKEALLLYKYNYDFNQANSPKLFAALAAGNLQEAARQMDATSKDPKFRKGLMDRRKREQLHFLLGVNPASALTVQAPRRDITVEYPVNASVYNPFAIQASNTQMMPVMVPDKGSYITTHEVSPSEQRAENIKNRFDAINRFNVLMDLINPQNNPVPEFMPTTGNSFLDALGSFANSNAKGGKIHIKPENRGKFTELKERTGHSATWFKEHGTPAQKKMATFALNARKWKHALGGNLFDGTSQPSQKIQIGLDVQGWPNYTTEQLVAYGEENERRRKAIQDAYLNFITESNDATAVANGRPQNQHLVDRAIQGAKAHAAWEKEHPNLTSWGNVLGAAPFVIASIPAVAGVAALGNAGAATSTGKAVTAALAPGYNAVTSSSIGGAPLLTWADAGLRSTMLTQGLEDLIKGKFTPETAIELSPATPAIIRTPGIIRNLQPQEIRNHLYVSKAPVGYEGIGDAIDRWTRGILSGKKADIENPWWLGNSDASIAKQALIKEYAPIPSRVQGTEREQFLEKWSDHALKARTDAWRMHNLIPQKYNIFTPSVRHPGAWTDEEGIKMLKWMPAQVEDQAQVDFISSIGGNIGIPTITRLGNGIPDTGTQLKRFGVTTTSDWFDLQPMSRPNDRLISRLQRYWNSTVSPRTDKVAKKIKDVSNGLRYDSKEIDSWMAANRDDEYAMEMFDPDMFPQSGIKRIIGDGLFGLSKKVAKVGSTPSFKLLKSLDEKLAKMEVGDITGGKPFLVQYDIPWTANTKFLDTGGISTEIVPGFQSENLLPQSVFDWRKGVVRNIEQPNLQYNPGDIDLLNLRLTTKSKKR